MPDVPNILAERYASPPMRKLWSAEGRIVLEREFWVAVMKAQRDLGLDIPSEAIADYESCREQVDLASIAERERISRHDVKARIEEFNALAGHQFIHTGMTSRDLTENVEQLQVFRSLEIVRDRAVAALRRMRERSEQWADLVITARTHNVAAQPTTLGKRIAMFGEELLRATRRIEALLADYPARGLKGAVGTRMDQLSLFDGDSEKADALEERVVAHLGLPGVMTCVGQVYPRSLDFETVAALVELASSPSSFARTLRLMAGHETASEGFAPGQTGSSAMPHKMNSRSCERINGFHVILKGHLAMAAGLAGDQWNEGDVACSVVRRVMLPDSFFAADGLFETLLTVLDQMDAWPAVIARENDRYMPFLTTTTVLMEAVKAGVGRESAHAAIKKHALAVVDDLRHGRIERNDLIDRLSADSTIPLDRDALAAIMASGHKNTGSAAAQIAAFAEAAQAVESAHPEAAGYSPGAIL